MDSNDKNITASAGIIQVGVILNILTSLLYINIRKNNTEYIKEVLTFIGNSFKTLTPDEQKQLQEMVESSTKNQMDHFLGELKKSLSEAEFQEITSKLDKIFSPATPPEEVITKK